VIKFFRNIRQNMINQNKVANYIKYAIGEIVLVMVGILLALQVSNWNNERKRNELEKVLLAQVKEEINRVYFDIQGDNNTLSLGRRSYARINDYIKNNASYADSMCFDFYWLLADEYIYPKEAVYGRIKDEGLDIIQNDSIKYLLQTLYESDFPRLSPDHQFYPNIEEFFSEYYQEHFKPNTDMTLKFMAEFPNDTISFPAGEIARTIGYVPLDFESLKKDTKFLMLLEQSRRYRYFKIRRYRMAKEAIENILPLIDKELAND